MSPAYPYPREKIYSTKKFGKKYYSYHSTKWNKPDANKTCKSLRKKGNNCRIVRGQRNYHIYIRKKKRI